ncbi:hypothetical protein CYMTET_45277, partial [Cymbomonas tetramitiformis]
MGRGVGAASAARKAKNDAFYKKAPGTKAHAKPSFVATSSATSKGYMRPKLEGTSAAAEVPVSIGDEILLSLYEPSFATGFVSSTLDEQGCVVQCLDGAATVPPDLSACRFFVYPKMQYNMLTELSRQLPELTEEELVKLLFESKQGSMGVNGEPSISTNLKENALYERYRPIIHDEIMTNLLELKSAIGEQVHFGDTIQLRHSTSRKFLSLDKSAAASMDPLCTRLHLLEHGSQSSWFTLLPGFKSKSLGEPVKYEDAILLQSTSIRGCNLHVSRTNIQESAGRAIGRGAHNISAVWEVYSGEPSPYVTSTMEVNAAGDAARLKVHPYALQNAVYANQHLSASMRSIGGELAADTEDYLGLGGGDGGGYMSSADLLLQAGSVVQIHHRESDTYLVCSPRDVSAVTYGRKAGHNSPRHLRFEQVLKASALGMMKAEEGARMQNSNSFWRIVTKDHMWGGSMLGWNREYRIKHVASDLYLCPTSLKPHAESRLELGAHGLRDKGNTSTARWNAATVFAIKGEDRDDQPTNSTDNLAVTTEYAKDATVWLLHSFEMWRERKDPSGDSSTFGSGGLLYMENTVTRQWLALGLPVREGEKLSEGVPVRRWRATAAVDRHEK